MHFIDLWIEKEDTVTKNKIYKYYKGRIKIQRTIVFAKFSGLYVLCLLLLEFTEN